MRSSPTKSSREFLIDLTDQVLRIGSKAARRVPFVRPGCRARRPLVRASGFDKLALAAGARLAPVLPQLVMPLATYRLRTNLVPSCSRLTRAVSPVTSAVA